MEISHQTTFRRTFLSRFLTLSFQATITHDNELLCPLADFCARTLLKREYFVAGTALQDLKGREPADIGLYRGTSVSRPPTSHELFYLAGEGIFGEEQDVERAEAGDFFFHLYSDFKEFQGSQHIIHSCRLESSPALPFPPRLSAFICPARVREFRFGLERFHPVRPIALLGPSPAVTEQLLIDGTQRQITMSITSDRISSKGELPFEGFSLIREIDSFLRDRLSFHFIESLQNPHR